MLTKNFSSEKKRTFLATTALDIFWDKTQSILFAGKWCAIYKNKKLRKQLDCQVFDASFFKEEEPEVVINKTNQIYRNVLAVLSPWLSEKHQIQREEAYWEIVVGSFLYMHIQTVYQRYRLLELIFNQHPELDTIGLSEKSFYIPRNTKEYYDLTVFNDFWNLQLFTQLITAGFKRPSKFQDYIFSSQDSLSDMSLPHKEKIKFSTRLHLFLLWGMIKCRGSKMICIPINGFSKKELLYLMITSGFRIVPLLPKASASVAEYLKLKTPQNMVLRREMETLHADDEFSKLILKTLVTSLPMSFLENYQMECEISKKYYPFLLRTICGISMVSGETVNLWVARERKKKIERIGWQPGGGFCILKYHSIEFMERELIEKYISWGNKDIKSNVISGPATHLCQLLNQNQGKLRSIFQSNQILWVASDFTPYPFELTRVFGMDYDVDLYYDWQSKILSLLSPDVFSQIVMRLRFSDFTDRWQYIRDEFPALILHKPKNRDSFFRQIWESKLLLFDNLNTTYSYGFIFNIPSLLFWDERIYTVRREVVYYFDILRDAKILHHTPESAANMINKIGHNPFEWWYSNEVQLARKQYCDYFLSTPSDWLKRWKDLMLEMIHT